MTTSKMRMSFWKEFRWWLASVLVNWALDLVAREITSEGLQAFRSLAETMLNEPEHDTVRMRRR